MTPTRVSELRATGQWWHVRRLGTLLPARGHETWPDRLYLPEPEVFHPDLLRYEQAMAAVISFRGSDMGAASVEQGLPGIFEYYHVLSEVVPPGEEFHPRFVLHPDGEHTSAGFYPPPPLRVDIPAADGGAVNRASPSGSA